MIISLATLLLMAEPAAPAATPAEPTVTDDGAEPEPAAPPAPTSTASEPLADPVGTIPAAAKSPDTADTGQDPWVEPAADHSVPPTSDAVERQANPALSEALKEPKHGKKGYAKYESPQRFAVELKFGPYLPQVDRNYSGGEFGPYAKVFGQTDDRGQTTAEPKSGLMTAAAFEWQFLNPGGLGPLGLGYQFSFFRDTAKALLAEPPADEDLSVRSEADSTVFWTMPMALQLVYRFEFFADRWRVPIVPYAKGGLAWALWWSKDGDGNLSRNSRDEKALGGVWGWQLNAGGMLRLDFLEIGTSRNLDRTTGINHTYLFGEFQYSRIDNFGRADSMSLGDATWFLGLALEF
ncbi:MAG: MXAN_2562 family outer membrane beta-barrel protein [Nannocystaceae bacterium]